MVTAFQPSGFQTTGYQVDEIYARRELSIIFNRVVVFPDIRFTQPMQQVRVGSLVYISVEIADNNNIPRQLINPTGSVLLTVFNPQGLPYLIDAVMLNQSLGRYFATIQTNLNDVLGLYYGRVAVTHAGATSYCIETGLFVLAIA